MKKAEQKLSNEICMSIWQKAMQEKWEHIYASHALNKCQACVYETATFFILISYNTAIACIDKSTDILYDMLRYEYGYTATSAQHIAKFAKKYTPCTRYTWRAI